MNDDNIELQDLGKRKPNESGSEEYHEISHGTFQESALVSKQEVTSIAEYDFFTQYHTEKIVKTSKKKKLKKKDKEKIMDVINSELAERPLLMESNVIAIDHVEEWERLIQNKPLIHKLFNFNEQRNIDAEHRENRYKTDKICPMFLAVLETNESKNVNMLVQYSEPSLFSEVVTEYLESDLKQNPKFLDIILKNIRFKYHHEFSLEKLICQKLIEFHSNYEYNKNALKEISRNIDVNRITRNNLKEQLLRISPNKKEDLKFDKNILKYTKAMLDGKEKYSYILKEQRNNVHHILSLWDDIETVREKADAITTDYILQVIQKDMEQSKFEEQWNSAFEIEYSDMLVKIEYDFVNNYLEYKELKHNFVRNDNGGSKIDKPKLVIDHDKLKDKVESIVNSIILKTNIDLVLKRDRSILTNTHNNKITSENDYCFKVFVDDVFVCESDHYFCESNLSLTEIIDYLSIEILSYNNVISIVLFENDFEMSLFTTPISSIRKNVTEASFLKTELVFNFNMKPNSKHVGSGYDIKSIAAANKVRLKSSNLFKDKVITTCELRIKLGWNEKLNNNQLESITSCVNIGRQLKQLINGDIKPKISLLTEVLNYIYNRNVQDDHSVMSAIRNLCEKRIINEDIFEVNGTNLDLTRIKLLHLRSKGALTNLKSKMIPLFRNQISTELLDALQISDEKHASYHNLQADAEMNSIDVQKFIGVKFVEKLNKNVINSVSDYLLRITYKDLVKDVEDFGIRRIFCNQTNLLVHAASTMSNQQFIEDSLTKENEIYVAVLRAFNLTDRSCISVNEGENVAGFKIHPLRPFVRVSYHGETAQTGISIGRHPTWNNTLRIKARFDPLSAIQVNIFDQYKDNASETHSDDQNSNSTVIYRKHNKWLGSVTIPLHTVLTLGCIRGTFKLNMPLLHFGYENSTYKEHQSIYADVNRFMKKETAFIVLQISTNVSHLGSLQMYHQPIPDSSDDDIVIRRLNEFVTDYVNDFPSRNISLSFIDSTGKNKCVTEFLQPIPLPCYEYFPRDPKKSESALSKSSGYSKSSSSKSSRNKQSIVDDKESIKSAVESWRSEESQLIRHMDAAIRYVSLIPTYEVTKAHAVTLLGVELLKVVYGSPLDHTILLASYFLNIGIKFWIAVGLALPRGLSSYILVQYYHNKVVMINDQFKTRGICGGIEGFVWYIYDAVTGERHELREIGCPLKTVHYVFDSENIWVNIQSSQECENVSFDFTKSSDWQTVFSKPLFYTKPILTEDLYSKPGDIEEIRLNLETKIRNKFQKWRSHVKTIWNRYCSTLLREMLYHWEYWSFNPTEPRPSPGHRLKQLMATYKIFGFPLNMPYLNWKSITSNIKSTSIHVNNDPDLEFAMAVEVFAYPNNVTSVWVFVATITRI